MSLAKTGSFALLAALSQQGFAVLHFLMIARWLTAEELGVWAMFVTLISFADMVRYGLAQPAVLHFGGHHPEARNSILTAGLVLNAAISLTAAAGIFAVGWLFSGVWRMPGLMPLLGFYPLLALVFGQVRFGDAARMVAGDFRGMFLSAFVFGSLNVALTFFFKKIIGSVSLDDLLFFQIVAALVTLPVVRLLGASRIVYGSLRAEWMGKLFRFGRYGMATNFFSMLFQRIDILLLGAFAPASSVAFYNVATRLTAYLDLPLNSLGQALFPKLTEENRRSGGDLTRLFHQSTGLLAALALPSVLAMIVFAEPLIWLLAGEQYLGAAALVRILALASLAKPWGRMFGITLDAVGKPEWNFRTMLVSFCINLGLNALFVPRWGVFGAAVASVLAVFLTVAGGQFLISRWLSINFRATIAQIPPAYRRIFAFLGARFRRPIPA